MKRQAIGGEKTLANHPSNKSPVTRTRARKVNSKPASNAIEKCANDINSEILTSFTQQDIQKHMKRQASLAKREVQMEPTTKHQASPLRTAKTPLC